MGQRCVFIVQRRAESKGGGGRLYYCYTARACRWPYTRSQISPYLDRAITLAVHRNRDAPNAREYFNMGPLTSCPRLRAPVASLTLALSSFLSPSLSLSLSLSFPSCHCSFVRARFFPERLNPLDSSSTLLVSRVTPTARSFFDYLALYRRWKNGVPESLRPAPITAPTEFMQFAFLAARCSSSLPFGNCTFFPWGQPVYHAGRGLIRGATSASFPGTN